jgi:phenylalanyl-tRNA synthetase alpha chain
MLNELEIILSESKSNIENVADAAALHTLKKALLGDDGNLTKIIKNIPSLDKTLKPYVGKRANEVKNILVKLIELRLSSFNFRGIRTDTEFDTTLPGILPTTGGLHPITQMCYDLNDAFRSLGFEIFQETDITSELYAFDKLNFPPDHPARESMDTYWIAGYDTGRGGERLCLRPHLTGGSVRYMQKNNPPYRFVYPGKVFRNETTDARHERAFFQYEALIVQEDFSFTAGKVMIQSILSKVFGRDVPVRMRVGFFPFVEPGFEIDMQCQVCGGSGCSVCKHVGWIEVMPGGTPHPNVLTAAGLDPSKYTGFYVNIGLDRLVMMRYGVDDVRLFHSTDLRFLSQFN